MRKSLQCQILASVLAISVLGLSATVQAASGGEEVSGYNNYKGKADANGGYHVIIEQGDSFNNVYGKASDGDVSAASLTMTGGTVNNVYGGYTYNNDVTYNTVDISDNGIVKEHVYGGFINELRDNIGSVIIYKNIVIINNNQNIGGSLHGGYINSIEGSYSENINIKENRVEVSNGSTVAGSVYGGRIATDDSDSGTRDVKNNQVIISSGSTVGGSVYGGMIPTGYHGNIAGNTVEISGSSTVEHNVYGGFVQTGGGLSGRSEIIGNIVKISSTVNGDIYGGMIENGSGYYDNVEGNKVYISNGGIVTGDIYGGYSANGYADDNSVTLSGTADVSSANIYGSNLVNNDTEGNAFIVNNWQGQQVNSLNNFNTIKFQNITWENEGVVVEVLNNEGTTSLADTKIDLRESTVLPGGTVLKAKDYMYFIKSANGSLGTTENNILVEHNERGDNIFVAGVALEGTAKVDVEEDGSVKYTIADVKNTRQTDVVPVNSSLGAGFIISGNDLVVDGLNAMEQDQLFGVKTFAIVEGNDSSYDVASDLKVNGWNGLYGVGNIKAYKDGTLSYAAFFENGTANYRTYNSFMDEVMRGDGSIVYNGGGIAGRYKKNDGFYTEASFRAGLLKNELKNMFKDGYGNIYGYDTESPYYAFHLGIGKVIDIEEDRNIDLYARYYHTYNDGDDFTVAGDRFEVDSVTSDKVRIGTRYNVNNDKDISTYYGLAWEYEFNGDADVSVNGQSLQGESLQGSSGFAEIGFVQRNSSPWSLEGRVRGYVGEREGVSGLLRVTYSF